ncbi:MAG: prepilin-type N-terminal cleavage/methylation domain-containing protein [Candidatus Fermentibacteraceae bacterium]|nr:prepilin-type N-terminal cleavage/methylation domain-containing protein [Candidatus Fermentibacteraceae bacterium]MBN2609054.1 prepilin-type N-terminal cleavage/methylation domain-containing protein [Candidatus Fermentibacteraceae bacterium]
MKNVISRFARGMTLVEIMIVLTVLLIVFAAVFLFFTRGSEEFDFARRQNELITVGRLALEEITDIILYAGYMPEPEWGNDEWHPVVQADSSEFEFYADYDDGTVGVLDNSDYRNIVVSDESFLVTDHGSMSRRIGSNITSMNFNYLDELSNPLPEPLSPAERDLVRHIQINLVLTDEYRGTDYSTEVSTTISPRNLGVNHNINPAFAPPDPLEGTVVFNVAGFDTIPAPTIDEDLMINMMIDWGLTVITLTDFEMGTFDFRGEDIDLIVLRHRGAMHTFPHDYLFYAYAGNKDTLFIPVVTLNAQDAVDIFDMGHIVLEIQMQEMTPANDWHPVNRYLPEGYDTFQLYDNNLAYQSILDSLNYVTPGDTVLTYPGNISGMSGVAVRDEESLKRVVHYSGWDASEYTPDGGWQMFYNVIKWNVGTFSHEYGTLIEEETFESPEDYSFVEPGYGEDSYCYVESPWTYIPDDSSKADYEAILRFSHCYWTRNRAAGGYLDIDTTWVDTSVTEWRQVPDEDLLVGYYLQTTSSGYPGGAGMDAYIDKSPGYNPSMPLLSIEEADLEGYRGKHVRFRWVFGVEDKASNNQDGWIVDDVTVLLVDRDTTALDSILLDPWTLYPDSLPIQPRFWFHHEMPGYNDHWYYHHLYNVDPVYPYAQGYAWTTWGEVGYIGPWTHGGLNDSWEIGVTVVPEFTPDPDPKATIYNAAHYAGNDLTYDDGYYNSFESSYLLSERWDIANTESYDNIILRIYRCIRCFGDDAFIHVGFSVDTLPPSPMDLSQINWFNVTEDLYVWANHTEWAYEEDPVIDLTDAFDSAMADSSYQYYWLLFTLFTGPVGSEHGGWNVDNIQVWGNNF